MFEAHAGEVRIFEIIEMQQERFPGIKALAPACAPGKRLEPPLDLFGQSQGQHSLSPCGE
jgi:hypothetical protein